MADTKICEACDAEIGASEKSCPKCGIDFDEVEEVIKAMEQAEKIREKRRAKLAPPAPAAPPAPPAKKKTGLFRSLGGKK